jgi:hypothetical protein
MSELKKAVLHGSALLFMFLNMSQERSHALHSQP